MFTFKKTVNSSNWLWIYTGICSVLSLLMFLSYWNVLSSEFISYDDPLYILERAQVWSGLTSDSIRWALTSTKDVNWIPVTWLSYLLDVSLFGVNAHGHHAVNLFLHLVNTLLLLLVLHRMTGNFWRSVVVSFFFALHPLHVESVAWIAERKDVLSGFFFMLTLLAYDSYAKKTGVLRYLLVMVFYVLGLLSKSMLVTMPFVLLLLDFWPLRRTSLLIPGHEASRRGASVDGSNLPILKLILEKIPLFLFALLSGGITYEVQKRAGAVAFIDDRTLIENMANALLSYAIYMYKTVVPVNLAVIYPFRYDIPLWQLILATLALAMVTLFVFRLRSQALYLLVGWCWFVVMLVPVIGLIPVGTQAMADRYTYLPHIGLFLMIVWGVADGALIYKVNKLFMKCLLIGTVVVFSVLTWLQVGYWRDSITLFNHAVSVTENNWVAYENLGSVFLARGDIKRASEYIDESLRINQRNQSALTIRGLIYQNYLRNDDALKCYARALEIDSTYAPAHYELGKNHLFNGNMAGALNEHRFLMQSDPDRAALLMKVITQIGPLLGQKND